MARGSGKSDEVAPAAVVSALAQTIDVLHTMEEIARGYRTYLIDHGWSDETADDLAADLLAGWQEAILRAASAPR